MKSTFVVHASINIVAWSTAEPSVKPLNCGTLHPSPPAAHACKVSSNCHMGSTKLDNRTVLPIGRPSCPNGRRPAGSSTTHDRPVCSRAEQLGNEQRHRRFYVIFFSVIGGAL
mmetsp:Transcript_24100/g.46901  ORF Transcript_24100/g.46901 Transcript_24100/m.46901 type:complete len:113 (-) Transcript_24100:250-588(-)|eukprot:CAMPEP_0172765878 /NCGR_PEP_ID=MMETSP1074-20121228/180145_1 /TAXON_ID=2916 /ORGANISM="Ceratium fusus, Strain PA161109" /LENGTH=112 /DNA_ID=CAMNT_0013600893 /DNA_START=110 /DNA_END=448 /DNA_ORIENTATION=+